MAMICILPSSLQIFALWSVGSKRGQRTSDVLSKGNQLLLQGLMDASVFIENTIPCFQNVNCHIIIPSFSPPTSHTHTEAQTFNSSIKFCVMIQLF